MRSIENRGCRQNFNLTEIEYVKHPFRLLLSKFYRKRTFKSDIRLAFKKRKRRMIICVECFYLYTLNTSVCLKYIVCFVRSCQKYSVFVLEIRKLSTIVLTNIEETYIYKVFYFFFVSLMKGVKHIRMDSYLKEKR